MKKKRLIPLLLLQNGHLVKSKRFCKYQKLGNPITTVKRLSEWASDELIYLDITKRGSYDLGREDLAYHNGVTLLDIIRDVSKITFMPITVGGGISTLEDIEKRLEAGADKIAMNHRALENPSFITQAAKEFGSQCIVISIDYVWQNNQAMVYSHRTKHVLSKSVEDWIAQVEALGAGELLVNSVERDGMQNGYDLDFFDKISSISKIPMIACGGVGCWEHFAQALESTKVDAIAAANIFHYSDQSVYQAKKYLYDQGYPMRSPELLEIN